MAESLGHTIDIEDFWPSIAGVLQVSVNKADQPLGGYEISDIECELRRLKPAQTQLVFSYLEN
ncbi:hypothetical protein GCM10008943_34160 [Paenochrobactrum glaciei]|uniref:Uncharacterized protein n=2 Tax=Paenochrobactrum glaciei TaxID=486407 RepID=A0ABP3RY15_9HYPH